MSIIYVLNADYINEELGTLNDEILKCGKPYSPEAFEDAFNNGEINSNNDLIKIFTDQHTIDPRIESVTKYIEEQLNCVEAMNGVENPSYIIGWLKHSLSAIKNTLLQN